MPEPLLLLAASLATVAIPLALSRRGGAGSVLPGLMLVIAGSCAAVRIAVRWGETGFGPFLTLYDILISNVASLALIAGIVAVTTPCGRLSVPFAGVVVATLSIWALAVSDVVVQLPASYDSLWLWLHVIAGKLFLAALMLATGIAVSPLRDLDSSAAWRGAMWRLVAVAFVCESAMLLSGAVWAQDAWGRYWAWDPVETWALVTWLLIAAALHVRLAWRLSPAVERAAVGACFAIAFLTLFGVPFWSHGPHAGVF